MSGTICRCDPLPPLVKPVRRDWICSGCSGERRRVEKMSVGAGGVVSQCGNCRFAARRRGAKVPHTLCRFFTQTRNVAGEFRDTATYYMCDACIDAELALYPTADVIDGRRATV